jgi:hypothetical protein
MYRIDGVVGFQPSETLDKHPKARIGVVTGSEPGFLPEAAKYIPRNYFF